MQEKSKKRIPIKIITTILIIVAVGLILPQQASALLSAAGIAKSFFTFLANLAIGIGGFLVKLAASVFESMLNLSFSTDYKAVAELAWTPVRDFANMFFILIMMVVAFATILRIEQYGIKKLLPKVIGIALLINFSLVMCYVIIDFSNLTAKSFINAAKNEATSLGNTKSSISAALSDSFKITDVLVPNKDCAKTLEDDLKQCESSPDPETCKTNAQNVKNKCEETKDATKANEGTGWDKVVNVVIAGIMGSIILIIAAFVLLAGAIMLIIRIVAIWLLVPLAPIVFICYLVPSLQSNWKKWWSTFINWCIFAPAYAFFIWLAVKVSVGKKLSESIVKTVIDPALNAGDPSTISKFFNSGQSFLYFAFTLGILLGGLIMAKQLGIAGANTAMAIGQKWKKGATDWAKRKFVTRPLEAGGKKLGAGVTGLGGKLFKGTTMGRRLEAKSAQIAQSQAQTVENKKYANLLNTMSDTDVEKEIQSAKGARNLIAVQSARKRGLLRETGRETAKKSMKTLEGFGDTEGLRSLEELRPDAVENDVRRKAAIERATKEGTHKKWSEKVFEGPEGVNAMEELRTQLGTGELTNVFKSWGKDIREQAEEALRGNFTDDFNNKKNIDRRNDFAKVTGKAYQSFYGDKAGTIQANYKENPNANKHAKEYIQKLNTDDFGNLKTDQDLNLAAQHMLSSQVYGAGTKLSGKNKNQMKRIAQRTNPTAYETMKKADTWTIRLSKNY